MMTRWCIENVDGFPDFIPTRPWKWWRLSNDIIGWAQFLILQPAEEIYRFFEGIAGFYGTVNERKRPKWIFQENFGDLGSGFYKITHVDKGVGREHSRGITRKVFYIVSSKFLRHFHGKLLHLTTTRILQVVVDMKKNPGQFLFQSNRQYLIINLGHCNYPI